MSLKDERKRLGMKAEKRVHDLLCDMGVEAELTEDKHPFDVLTSDLAIEVKSVNGNREFSMSRKAYARKRLWARENARCPMICVVERATGEVRIGFLANCDWTDLVTMWPGNGHE